MLYIVNVNISVYIHKVQNKGYRDAHRVFLFSEKTNSYLELYESLFLALFPVLILAP